MDASMLISRTEQHIMSVGGYLSLLLNNGKSPKIFPGCRAVGLPGGCCL
jgi:hypothetical protein